MADGPAAGVKGGRSLVDFAKELRRADCKVCQLPEELMEQIKVAPSKGIRIQVVLRWLADDYGTVITEEEMVSHRNGRH